jgi:hypothetical protein
MKETSLIKERKAVCWAGRKTICWVEWTVVWWAKQKGVWWWKAACWAGKKMTMGRMEICSANMNKKDGKMYPSIGTHGILKAVREEQD